MCRVGALCLTSCVGMVHVGLSVIDSGCVGMIHVGLSVTVSPAVWEWFMLD